MHLITLSGTMGNMAKRATLASYGQTAAMTLFSILAEAVKGEFSPAVVAAGGFSALAGVLIHRLTERTEHDDAEREALESALHNEHLAHAAADAVKHTLLASKDILDKKRLHQLADAAGEYWLQLLREDDPRNAVYAEKDLPARLREYLNGDQIEPRILLSQWKQILIEGAASKNLTLGVDDFQWNSLAGYVCREYPRQLYTTFKTDLEHKGAAFGGVVLRMLAEISHSVHELRTQPVRDADIDLTPIYRHFEEFTQTVLNKTRDTIAQLDPAAQKAREELLAFRDEMRATLASLQLTADLTLSGVSRLQQHAERVEEKIDMIPWMDARSKRWAAGVLALLIVIAALIFWQVLRPQSPVHKNYSFAGKWEATQIKYSVPQMSHSLPTAWGGIRIFVDQALHGEARGHLEVDNLGQYTLDMSAEDWGEVTASGNTVDINRRFRLTGQTATQQAYYEEMTFRSVFPRHAITVEYSVTRGALIAGIDMKGWYMQFDKVTLDGHEERHVGWRSPSLSKNLGSHLPDAITAHWIESDSSMPTWKGTLDITPDGKYRFKTAIHEAGVFQAENGHWHRAPAGGIAVDGTYDAHDVNTVTTADSQGAIIWKRVGR